MTIESLDRKVESCFEWGSGTGLFEKVKRIGWSLLVGFFVSCLIIGIIAIFGGKYNVDWMATAMLFVGGGTFYHATYAWEADREKRWFNFFTSSSIVLLGTLMLIGMLQLTDTVDFLTQAIPERIWRATCVLFLSWMIHYLFRLHIPVTEKTGFLFLWL